MGIISIIELTDEEKQYSFDFNMATSITTASTNTITNAASPVTTGTISSGTVGSVLQVSSGGGLNWNVNSNTATQYGYYNNSTTITANVTSNNVLRVKGDAEFHGKITIKGISLDERFDEIEKRLCILRPNNDLEGKWEKLKELGEQYRQLEQEILEKEQMWEILKK